MRRSRFGRSDLVSVIGVVVLVVTVWCLAYGTTSRAAWETPVSYRGDALFLLSYLKAAGHGHVVPGGSLLVPELNAPFQANWNDHPRTLREVFLVGGVLSRWTGLFVAANLLLLLAHVLCALSFYPVARYFGARQEWASAGALMFGLSHYLFWRSFDHLDLAFAWHLPLCVLVVAWAFSRRGIEPLSRRFWAALAITAVAALHNPYYGCLYAQFLLLAALTQAIRRRGRGLLAGPIVLILALGLTFVADQAGTLVYQWREGPNAGAVRPYGNLERYALKPLELVIPRPGSGLFNWGRVARVYWSDRLYRAEGGSPYLGVVGAAALVWLAGLAAYRLLQRPAQAPPSAFLAVVWIVLFSILGGLNQVLGLLGFVWLRAPNRYSVWILTLVLLFLVVKCSRVIPRRFSLATAFLMTLVALVDQVHAPAGCRDRSSVALAVEADRQFTKTVEAELPTGSMIFLLPVTEFPEGQALGNAGEYDHLRLYLFSNHLRFSFGSDRGRPRELWQRRVESLPPLAMADRLERFGFAGIVVNRRAYADSAEDLLSQLRDSGRGTVSADWQGRFALVRLRPAGTAHLPEGSEEDEKAADQAGSGTSPRTAAAVLPMFP